MKMYQLLVLISVSAACFGCTFVPLPDRNLQSRIEEDAVVGTWSLTAESLQHLKRGDFVSEDSHQNTIRFLDGGNVEFRSVLTFGFDETYYEVEGTWELRHDIKSGANALVKNRLTMILSAADGRHEVSMDFAEDESELILWEFYGDPDSWEFLEYRKQGGS